MSVYHGNAFGNSEGYFLKPAADQSHRTKINKSTVSPTALKTKSINSENVLKSMNIIFFGENRKRIRDRIKVKHPRRR